MSIKSKIYKIFTSVPAVQYEKRHEERVKKTEQGREFLSKNRTLRQRVRTFKDVLKKKFRKYDE